MRNPPITDGMSTGMHCCTNCSILVLKVWAPCLRTDACVLGSRALRNKQVVQTVICDAVQ